MNQELIEYCDNYLEDYNFMNSTVRSDFGIANSMYINILISKGVRYDSDLFYKYKKMVRNYLAIPKCIKHPSENTFATVLLGSLDPEEAMNAISKIYYLLRNNYKKSTLVAAECVMLYENGGNTEKIIARAREIYKVIRKKHFLAYNDYVKLYCLELATLEMDCTSIIYEVEKNYENLKFMKDKLFKLSMAIVLVLGKDSSESKCKKLQSLHKDLKDNGIKVDISELFTLSVTSISNTQIISRLTEIYNYLKENRPYNKAFNCEACEKDSIMLLANYYNSIYANDNIISKSPVFLYEISMIGMFDSMNFSFADNVGFVLFT
ncbi:MAG: DUF4003 domain-containing protein [Lachnospiraceae bacterium]|nr:DUF4003 domain-containing protein [Lachnospiraceae bacterium]